jgi:outer membrane biogenesis lipoprotein LolB
LAHLVVLILFVSVHAGCAHLFPPPEDHPQARQILMRLAGNNAGLERFKALAHVRMELDSQVVSGRIALAAEKPDKLRIEWLNMLGQPLASLSGNGETITIISRTDNKVHRLSQSPAALEPLIHIPIGIEDLQNVLAGRIPLSVDVAVQLNEAPNDIDILILKNRWHNMVATLRVDRLTCRVLAMQTFSPQGVLQYEIQWLQWRNEGAYLIPVKMVFESESGKRVELSVDRFWPDVDLPASIFKLDIP